MNEPGNTVAYNTQPHTDETRHGNEAITKESMKGCPYVLHEEQFLPHTLIVAQFVKNLAFYGSLPRSQQPATGVQSSCRRNESTPLSLFF
jgi:hypothetical protein